MLKSTSNKETKTQPVKRVKVIKNGHSATDLSEAGERWADHEGLYLTLAEVLAIEQAKPKKA